MATTEQLVQDARTYAAGVMENANDAIEDMQDRIDEVGFTVVSVTGVNLPSDPPIPDPLIAPDLNPVDLTLPAEPGAAPLFQDISAIELSPVPRFDTPAPTILLPDLPGVLPDFLEQAPQVNTSFTFPTVPDALTNPLPMEPTVGDYPIPVAPQIILPTFDTPKPEGDIEAPTDYAAQFVTAYRDAQPGMVAAVDGYLDGFITRFNPRYHVAMASIEAQLERLLAGGSGLNPAVENQIYERARSKGAAEHRRVERAAWSDAAARGFTLPDGVLQSSLRQARQGAADNNAAAAREIVIKQAEMEQANLQFAVTTSVGLRTALLSAMLAYHGNLVQLNGQALESAKAIVGAAIDVYNASIRAFAARLDAWKAEAAVFETRLKAALAGIELYQAEIQALLAMVNVDRAKVDVYKARIDSLQSAALVYRSQIEAVVSKAGLERLKLDLYEAKVRGFNARVQGKELEFRGYTAAIQGQEAVARVFQTQAQAHTSQVNAFRAEVDAKAEVVRAAAATNQARASQYSAVLSGYSAVVQARGEVARTKLENQRQEIMAFQAESQAQIANATLRADVYKAKSQVIIEKFRLDTSTMFQAAGQNLERSKAIAQMGVSSAQVYSSVAASTMSGMNTLIAQTRAE